MGSFQTQYWKCRFLWEMKLFLKDITIVFISQVHLPLYKGDAFLSRKYTHISLWFNAYYISYISYSAHHILNLKSIQNINNFLCLIIILNRNKGRIKPVNHINNRKNNLYLHRYRTIIISINSTRYLLRMNL